MRKHSSRIFAAVAAAGLMASLSACQVKPGDYRIYKITNLPTIESADCPGDPDIRDVSTFYGASSFAIFATDPETYFLEFDPGIGATTLLEGTRDGGDYTFLGDSTSVEDLSDTAIVTDVVDVDVNLTIKGHQISGTVTTFTSTTCNGDCGMFENTTCTRTTEFIGSEIKDVELERPV